MHVLTRFSTSLLLSTLAACGSAPTKKGSESIPLDGAQITFWNKSRKITLKLDSHDEIELLLVEPYKEFKSGTKFRLYGVGEALYLVVERSD